MAELAVENLAVARAGIPVLTGVSFRLEKGEALVLRGPNGIGKTTLLRTIAGLQPALSGRVSQPSEAMAYAGHADGLKATLSVRENIRFWAEIYGSRNWESALSQMDLSALAERMAQSLSAGQKRRLGLARLIVTQRPIWLLDEPTVSLDQASVALFAQMLRRHIGQGGAAVLASHIDLGLAEAKSLELASFRADPASSFDGAFL